MLTVHKTIFDVDIVIEQSDFDLLKAQMIAYNLKEIESIIQKMLSDMALPSPFDIGIFNRGMRERGYRLEQMATQVTELLVNDMLQRLKIKKVG